MGSSVKRTPKQIADAITGLRAIQIKPTFRKLTSFSADNVAAIDAQIEVLQHKLTVGDVEDREEQEEFTEYQANSAMEAVRWLEGYDESDPVKGWEDH